ncbi:MAG: DNA polymerase III subunit delta [Gammaproteobacteria bacterium RIFCSPHIGHO2_12_FULL_37_14]|nr:MAG: DNA polymerase III subunit delta [Gammaproteobacteria bacterium RIFCSPHIGHO2_12_FULL_37_14]
MKLTYFQLEPHLTKKLAPVYLIGGEDVLLKQDSVRMIRKAAKHAGFSGRLRLSIDTGLDEQQLYSTLNSPSLFSEKQLLEINLPSFTTHKTLVTILSEYLKNPSSQHLLLITTGKIDSKISKNNCYQAIENSGVIITIWPLSHEQLLQWIHYQAKKYRLQLNAPAANLLANYAEGNLIAIAQAIEKCYLLQPQKIIDEDLIDTLMVDDMQFTIFDLVDSMIAGNVSRSLRILGTLKLNSCEPTLIIWAIARELRLLNDMAQQIKQGMSFEDLFKKNRVFIRRQSMLRSFLKKFSATDYWRFLLDIANIDRCIKGAIADNPWNRLQMLCLKLTPKRPTIDTTTKHPA